MVFCTQDYLSRRHEMLQERAPRPPQSGRANTASAVQGANTRPDDDEKPSLNFDDDFEAGFALTGLLAGSSNRYFHPNGDRFMMTVDSGASHHVVDDELIPSLRKSIRCYKKQEPKTIVTNESEKVFATATGTI